MSSLIIDRGRGPEIVGTRITIYDIWDYAREGHPHAYIADNLGLSTTQVMAALEYIDEHKEEVLADYQIILDRIAKGHPSEVQVKVDAIHAKYEKLWEDRRAKARINGDARLHRG